jgi:hypothetical protein
MKENTIIFLILISYFNNFVVAENDCFKRGRTWSEEGTVYRKTVSSLALIACCLLFYKVFETGLWVVWEEQLAPYAQFCPRSARKKSNKPKLNISLAHQLELFQ